MIINAPCVVSLTWTLTDAQNRAIDALDTPTEFFFGGDDLLASIEDAIAGQDVGFETHIQIEPEQAFGEYKPALVCFEPRSIFPPALEVGVGFEGLPEGHQSKDMPTDVIYLVSEIFPEHVVLDGNHPLAGMALRIKLQVRAVRAATDEEVQSATVGGAAVSVLRTAPGPKAIQ